MERFVIEGGHPLNGTIRPSGNKNAALPLLATALLSDEPVTLHNIPNIGDVRIKLQMLEQMGVTVTSHSRNSHTLHAAQLDPAHLDTHLARKIRTSPLLAAPMLARAGAVTLPRPGGDAIGRRRLDTHFLALRALGASVEVEPRSYVLHCDRLTGADIFLDEMSVTGTEQAVIAASVAAGHTTIRNAASEPHVQDVCNCLNAMGARITGIGTNVLEIEGVPRLHGATYTIGPDFMEVGSLLGLAAVTGSSLRIAGARPLEHRMTRIMYSRMGIEWQDDGDDLVIGGEQEMRVRPDLHGAIPKIDSAPWPGFSPDLISTALVVATQVEGTTLIHEKMFESRLFFADKLLGMGARIVLCDPHRAVVVGRTQLYGEENLPSPDIRAGMALLTAALCAKGQSSIYNIQQIDRGYERIEERLATLGARIERRAD